MPAPNEVWIDNDTNKECVIDVVDGDREQIKKVVLHDPDGGTIECSESEFFQRFRRKAA